MLQGSGQARNVAWNCMNCMVIDVRQCKSPSGKTSQDSKPCSSHPHSLTVNCVDSVDSPCCKQTRIRTTKSAGVSVLNTGSLTCLAIGRLLSRGFPRSLQVLEAADPAIPPGGPWSHGAPDALFEQEGCVRRGIETWGRRRVQVSNCGQRIFTNRS